MNNLKDWVSERILFGLLIIVGYFSIVAITFMAPLLAAFLIPVSQLPAVENAVSAAVQNAKDALLVIGPLLGMIVQAIWKTDKADKQNAESLGTLATAAAATLSASPPPTVAEAPPSATPPDPTAFGGPRP